MEKKRKWDLEYGKRFYSANMMIAWYIQTAQIYILLKNKIIKKKKTKPSAEEHLTLHSRRICIILLKKRLKSPVTVIILKKEKHSGKAEKYLK